MYLDLHALAAFYRPKTTAQLRACRAELVVHLAGFVATLRDHPHPDLWSGGIGLEQCLGVVEEELARRETTDV